MTAWDLPEDDIEAAVAASRGDLERWRGARILFTGATGALGSWMLTSLERANEHLGMKMSMVVATRSSGNLPASLREAPGISTLEGDVRSLSTAETFDLIIHGAAGASTPFGVGDAEPREMASTIVDGTRAVLECAAANMARVLFLSSGGVYGPQFAPAEETTHSRLDCLDPRAAYGEAKRLAELYCAAASSAGEVDAVIARIFALTGPRIPLDSYFAAGNFMGDLIAGRPINVSGDGRPFRSYLYCGDLPEWCFALMSRGSRGEAYNVGSDEAVTIAQLAHMIAALDGRAPKVVIHAPESAGPSPWYVPRIDKARGIGLEPRTSLQRSLEKWFAWLS